MTEVRLEWPGRKAAEQVAPALLRTLQQSAEGQSKGTPESYPESTPNYHRVICSDNLQALGLLLAERNESFHFIYIDPPYNTGQRFAYSDKQPRDTSGASGSSAWLSFMLPRLQLARELLTPNGLMCVSIDDHEQATLTVLMRELFGSSNHIMTIKWRRKRKPSFLAKHSSRLIEYILVFAKDQTQLPKLQGPRTSESSRPVLNQGNAVVKRRIKKGTPALVPDGTRDAGVYKGRSLNFELHDPLVVANGRVVKDCMVSGPFRVSQEILDRSLFVTKTWGLRRKVLDSEQKHRHASDDGTAWPTNEDADSEMKQCFGERIFAFAKPVGMLRKLISMYVLSDTKTAIRCLDFFAGSGSFGAAVCAESHSDGVSRTVTLIQSDEPIGTTDKYVESAKPPRRWGSIFELTAHRMLSQGAGRVEILDWRASCLASRAQPPNKKHFTGPKSCPDSPLP